MEEGGPTPVSSPAFFFQIVDVFFVSADSLKKILSLINSLKNSHLSLCSRASASILCAPQQFKQKVHLYADETGFYLQSYGNLDCAAL